ncbi:MAG: nucleotidyltransferase domain-containing protein [Oscillospiraceae bacterium]|jgi:predicted nucleotidyltransferase|nr:nucleotidyltransferase domain-containing protein [Oscillospiraceae bacterium]
MIGVTQSEMCIVQDILRRYALECDVVAFGSRTTQTYKPYSDLDLALRCGVPLSISQLSKIQLAFSESDLPFRVDIVDYNNASPEFRRIIDAHAVRISM